MPVRDQNFIETFETDPGLQDLALRPFSAIDEKAIFVVLNDLRRQVSSSQGRRSRGP